MKKCTVLFLLSFLCIAPALSQDWFFGVKGGVNVATGSSSGLPFLSAPPSATSVVPDSYYAFDSNHPVGFYAGGFGRYSFAPKWALQADVLFSRQNFEEKRWWVCPTCNAIGNPIATSYDLKVDYLTVPVVVKYTLFKNLSAEVGPQMAFLLDAELDYQASGSVANAVDPLLSDYKKGMRKADWAIVGGLTYTLFDHLDITARYQQGLGNAYKKDSSGDYTNKLFQLGLGYRF